MPIRIANDPRTSFGKQIVKTVETIEDKGSCLRIVAKIESKGLSFQRMKGKTLQQTAPLSALAFRSPSGDAEDKIVNKAEDSLWDMMRAGGLRSQMIGDVLGARLPQHIFMLVDNDGRFHFNKPF
jgi:hypothetical protein